VRRDFVNSERGELTESTPELVPLHIHREDYLKIYYKHSTVDNVPWIGRMVVRATMAEVLESELRRRGEYRLVIESFGKGEFDTSISARYRMGIYAAASINLERDTRKTMSWSNMVIGKLGSWGSAE
jgi:hypothetical protein